MKREFYTVKESAEAFGVSYVWLSRMIREERVKAVWFGGQRLIRADEYKRLVEEGIE